MSQGVRRLQCKYDRAFQNMRRHPLFTKQHDKWGNVCRRLADKLGFYHHPFQFPPWSPKSTREKSLEI